MFDDNGTPSDVDDTVPTFQIANAKLNDGVTTTPGWVTDTVRVTCGEPLVVVNVTVALRDADAVFA